MAEILEEELYPSFNDLEEDFYGREEEYEDDELGCDKCGPWCPDWMGDNLCRIDIDNFAMETEEYLAKHKLPGVMCPVCQKDLDCFSVAADELWVWPGGWYDPRVGLFEVYSLYGCPKGEIHSKGKVHHIWIGEGEYRQEKLILLMGKQGRPDQ